MLKKLEFFIIGLLLAGTGIVLAAPVSNIFRSVVPETDDTYFVGTTTTSNARYTIRLGTATSTGAGGIEIKGGAFPNFLEANFVRATSTTATSTFAYGINLTGGCVAIGGTCVGSGSGTVTGTGGINQLSYWTSSTNLAATTTPTATIFIATSTTAASSFPIASTTSFTVLDRITVNGTGTSTYTGGISISTNGGLSTASGITITAGSLLGSGIGATLGSTTVGGLLATNGVTLTNGCFSVNGACIGGGGGGSITGTGGVNQLTYWTTNTNIAATSSPTSTIFVATSTSAESVFPYSKFTSLAVGTTSVSGTLSSGVIASSSPIIAYEFTDNPAATMNINWASGQHHRTILNQNTTLTFQNGIPGGAYTLEACQDGTGSRLITWDSLVQWSGGQTPVLSTTANKCDIMSFYYTQGTTTPNKYFGSATLGF